MKAGQLGLHHAARLQDSPALAALLWARRELFVQSREETVSYLLLLQSMKSTLCSQERPRALLLNRGSTASSGSLPEALGVLYGCSMGSSCLSRVRGQEPAGQQAGKTRHDAPAGSTAVSGAGAADTPPTARTDSQTGSNAAKACVISP